MRRRRLRASTPTVVVALALLLGTVGAGACSADPADERTQNHLLAALETAKAFRDNGDTYLGFGPGIGRVMRPKLRWKAITVTVPDADTIVMYEMSSSGQTFCIARSEGAAFPADDLTRVRNGETLFGRGAATTYETCTGGW